jgi:hypothetical protein
MYMIHKHLKEKLDFSFSIKDFEEISKLLEDFLLFRIDVFKELFCSNKGLEKKSKNEYIHFFITQYDKDESNPDKPVAEQHHFLSRIQHFLSRNYEFFTLPEVQATIQSLLYCFTLTKEDIEENYDNFEEFENNIIDLILDKWDDLYSKVQEYPFLTIKEFKNEIIQGVSVYYKENSIDNELLEIYKHFIVDMNTVFPKSLKRIDSILFVPQSYIDFTAGEGTTAFFLEDEIFMPEQIVEKDKKFFVETLYHEFGHFIFALLTETNQILWYKYYDEWSVSSNIKLTREYGKNEVEELFADAFSRIYSPLHDFIQEPSTVIIDTVKNILQDDF